MASLLALEAQDHGHEPGTIHHVASVPGPGPVRQQVLDNMIVG